MQTVAGQSFELFGRGHIDGDIGTPAVIDEVESLRHAFQPRFFDQQRERLTAGCQSTVNDLGGFGDEHAFGGLEPITQLHFGEAHICLNARIVNGIQRDELHGGLSCEQITKNPLQCKGSICARDGT